ncbi:helix-turn-helix transcriptional regulator [Alicyclobacillus sendaiensis]|uniref:helix-turn-helix transcriptional regulator n=1 Tax=Alicyclobacillus sendaiensis TaxID=192387 RepID=UPI0026F46FEF|nr:helix-turn-helix transcriptional regulator [Alicyclobacillus sendaiensis]
MNRLREFRERMKLTQTELSKRTGIPQTTISCWERNIGEPNISDAQRLASVLQADVNEIFPNEISFEAHSTSEQGSEQGEHTA